MWQYLTQFCKKFWFGALKLIVDFEDVTILALKLVNDGKAKQQKSTIMSKQYQRCSYKKKWLTFVSKHNHLEIRKMDAARNRNNIPRSFQDMVLEMHTENKSRYIIAPAKSYTKNRQRDIKDSEEQVTQMDRPHT